MARSLASPRLPAGVAAVTLAVLCGVASGPRPRPRPLPAAALAAHEAGAALAWGEAPVRVYETLERTALAPAVATRVARAILEESLAASLDPALVLAMIHVESRFDPRAVSPAGALGLMQLMPPTHRQVAGRAGLHADPFDPVGNVRAGIRYFTQLVEAFGDLELALMAYNAGPARIRAYLRAGGVPARFLRYPRDVLRQVRSAAVVERVASAPPARRPGIAHAHAPAGAAAVVASVTPQPPGSFAHREPPRDAGQGLPRRRAAIAPAVLLIAA